MRIFILGDYYVPYLTSFHERHKQFVNKLPYGEHLDLLCADYFGSFVSYRNYFRKIGHDCDLVVANYFPLQQKWADDHGLKIRANRKTQLSLVLRQIEEYQPDIFFIGSIFDYFGEFLKRAQGITPNIFAWIACPFPETLDLSAIRCIISSASYFVDMFRKKGVNSEFLRAGFDAAIIQTVGSPLKNIPLSFIGALSAGSHSFRTQCLERLIKEEIPLNIWGYGLKKSLNPFIKNPIERRYQGGCWGVEMYRTLARSQITLNFHIDITKDQNWVGNMRMYEATGCGAMLITDDGSNVSQIFTPGVEIETYASYEELKKKVLQYLHEPEAAGAIARAGQIRCLAEHNYDLRIKEFESVITRYAI
jgi:spore maturation protein CgeB